MGIRFQCSCGKVFKVPSDAAGKKAKCLQCGKILTVPHPRQAPGQRERRAPDKPQRPRAASRPAAPPGGDDEDLPVARAVPEDDLPVAALVQEPSRPARQRHLRPRRPQLNSVKISMFVALGVVLWVALDVIVALATGVREGLKGLGWLHAGWLPCGVIGLFIAAAATKGNRFSIGLLAGGAIRAVLNGIAILLLVAMGSKLWLDLPAWMMIYGWGALAAGGIHLVLLLVSRDTRKHNAGHGGTIAGAAVMGAVVGGFMAPTALPGPLFLTSRMLARPGELTKLAGQLGAPELIGEEGKREIRVDMRNKMVVVGQSLTKYINTHHNRFPPTLAALVSKDCPAKNFLCMGSKNDVPEVDEEDGTFSGDIDVEYVLGAYHLFDLPEQPDELRQLVVAHSDPNCHFGEGAIVLRPPGKGYPLVGWVDKEMLEDELRHTRRWMKRNPPRKPMKIGE